MTTRTTLILGVGIGILVGIGAALLLSGYAPDKKYKSSETVGEETSTPFDSTSKEPPLPEVSDIPGTKQIHETIETFKLSSRKRECLLISVWGNDTRMLTVEVRENHTPECGGDPETSPRLFALEIHKNTGKAYSDRF